MHYIYVIYVVNKKITQYVTIIIMQVNQLFGRNIRFLRKAAGIATRGNSFSQQEIADFLGVSRKTIVFWESGHIPSDRMMGQICEFFSRRLQLEEPFVPEKLFTDDISEEFLLFPERAEVRRVSPEQKKMISQVFVRASSLSEKDLEKLLNMLEKLSKEA